MHFFTLPHIAIIVAIIVISIILILIVIGLVGEGGFWDIVVIDVLCEMIGELLGAL